MKRKQRMGSAVTRYDITQHGESDEEREQFHDRQGEMGKACDVIFV